MDFKIAICDSHVCGADDADLGESRFSNRGGTCMNVIEILVLVVIVLNYFFVRALKEACASKI